jgi:hypothetical protein
MDLDSDTSRPTIPTGRVDTGLGVLQIHVVDLASTHRYDPNTAKIAAITESLNLGKPVGPSDLSGEPGYIYRTHEMQLVLTKGELSRLLLRDLHPAEVLKLRKWLGDFFEIHNDFYDDEGNALQ